MLIFSVGVNDAPGFIDANTEVSLTQGYSDHRDRGSRYSSRLPPG